MPMLRLHKPIKLPENVLRKIERAGRRFQIKITEKAAERGLVRLTFNIFGRKIRINLAELNKKARDYYAKMKTAEFDLKEAYANLAGFLSLLPQERGIVRLEGENLRKWAKLQKKFHSAEIKFYSFELKFLKELSEHVANKLSALHPEEIVQLANLLSVFAAVIKDVTEKLKIAREGYDSVKKMV